MKTARGISFFIVLCFWCSLAFAEPTPPNRDIPNPPNQLGGVAAFPVKDVDPPPPTSPGGGGANVSVTGGVEEGFKIEWTNSVIPATSYRIERRYFNSGWYGIGTVGANVFTFTDTAVEANRRYHYRVIPYVSATPQAVIGPADMFHSDGGSLQQRSRTGTATLHGFVNFLPETFNSLYGSKTESERATRQQNIIEPEYSDSESEKYQSSVEQKINIDNGEVTSKYSGSASREDVYDGHSFTVYSLTQNEDGSWSDNLNQGNNHPALSVNIYNDDLPTVSEGETIWNGVTKNWSASGPVYSPEMEVVGSYSNTEVIVSDRKWILSEKITGEQALSRALDEAPPMSDDDWDYTHSNFVGSADLKFGAISYGLTGHPGTIGASAIELEYRLAFNSKPLGNSVDLVMQVVDVTLDDPNTTEVLESDAPPKYSYVRGGVSGSPESDIYVSSPRALPAGGMEPNHSYHAVRVEARLTVSDYRGLADDQEKFQGPELVHDPYEDEPFYKPEVEGPMINLSSKDDGDQNAAVAYVSAGFSGGVDKSEWSGVLSWSGPVRVLRSTADGWVPVSSPINLGYQADNEGVGDGVSLVVRSSNGTEGTAFFNLVARDSKGVTVADDAALINVVDLSPEFRPGRERPDYYTIPLSDATGPKYRKISPSGRPIPDHPLSESETDSAKEETYVDAFSLNLRHSVTDIYVPVPGSKLALTVRRNLDSDVWNFSSGLRPHERPDRPFGSGWSSNIAASIEFVTIVGPDADGYVEPPEAIVTDDDGNRTRFFKYESYYFPYPSGPHDAKAYLCSLSVTNDGKYEFKRKHGKTLLFAPVTGALVLANDRIKGGTSGKSYSYARLERVRDTIGYSLVYTYGGASTLVPNKIEAHRPNDAVIPGHRIFIRQNDQTRCVTAIWDPSGNKTDFSYKTYTFDHPRFNPPIEQRLFLLSKVSAPDSSDVEYVYEGESSLKRPFVIEKDPIPHRNPSDGVDMYHVNLSGMSQKAGTSMIKYGFEYEMDSSKQTYVKVPGFEDYVRQAGAPRRIKKIALPTGKSSSFANIGFIKIVEGRNGPSLQGQRGSIATDANGSKTTYSFGGVSVLTLSKFKDLYAPQEKGRNPKMVYYTSMEISSAVGSEKYTFDINAGLALAEILDLNKNRTVYNYTGAGSDFTPPNPLFREILPQGFFRYDDPKTVTRGSLPSRKFSYTSSHRLLKEVIDENGNSTSYVYDSGNKGLVEQELRKQGTKVIQQTDFQYHPIWVGFVTKKTIKSVADDSAAHASDLVTDFLPDEAGRVASKTVNLGIDGSLVTSYLYNWNNQKVYVTEPGGGVAGPEFAMRTLFTYDRKQRLRRVTFEDDSYKENFYDGRGRKTAERDENGNVTSFGYDLGDRVNSKIRRMPQDEDISESYEYNDFGSLVRYVNPRAFTTINEYDAIQRLSSKDEPGMGVTRFSYGANSGPSVTEPASFQPTNVVDGRGFATVNTYDNYYRLTVSERSYGTGIATMRFKYDPVGNKTDEYDALGRRTDIDYDGLNRPYKVTNAHGKYEESWFTSTGLLWKKRDLRGAITTTKYDLAGRPVLVTLPSVVAGTPKRKTQYDRAGNVALLEDARHNQTTFKYDVRNRLVLETRPLVYDAESGQVRNPTIQKAYDAVGNLTDVIDPRSMRTHMVYDAANRQREMHIAYLTGEQVSTYTLYDACGNPEEVTDARGVITTNKYDEANRLSSSTNGVSAVTSFDYDKAGNRTLVVDGKGQATTFSYDGFNRVSKTTDSAGKEESYKYNSMNKIERTDSLGRKTSYQYDNLNRLTDVIYSGSPYENIKYSYNDANQITGADQPGTERDVSYDYDALGSVISETSNGETHEYNYDLAGNRTGFKLGGSQRQLVFGYDSQNRMESVTDGSRVTEYRYTLAGGEASRSLKVGGVTVTNVVSTFDGLGRLDLRTGFEHSNQIYSYDHGYDGNGNVTSISEDYSSGLTDRSLSLQYDNANRLITESIASGGTTQTTVYGYDSADNCTSKSVALGSGAPTVSTNAYNNLNQLTGTTFSDTTPSVQYRYDSNGNRVSRAQASDHRSYTYDYENRLSSVRLGVEAKTIDISPVMGGTVGDPTQAVYYLGSGDLHTYMYDYRCRRVQRNEDGAVTNVIFSGGTSSSEWTDNATSADPTVEFVRGIDLGGGVGGLLYSLREEASSSPMTEVVGFGHYNARGDVVAKTNGVGRLSYQAAYEARGTRTQENLSTLDRQKANTKDEDPTGLLNEGFRYRDLETGTFLTRDPAGFIDGPNLYAYVRQNPWSKFDPIGLEEKSLQEMGQDIVNNRKQLNDLVNGEDPEEHGKVAQRIDEARDAAGVFTAGANVATELLPPVAVVNAIAGQNSDMSSKDGLDRALGIVSVVPGLGMLKMLESSSDVLKVSRVAVNEVKAAKGGGFLAEGKTVQPFSLSQAPSAPVQVADRLSPNELRALTDKHGVEFALFYRTGAGKNGGGGTYWLTSGERNKVYIPQGKDVRLIYHTHPQGSTFASSADRRWLRQNAALGSPQKASRIVPSGRDDVSVFDAENGTW